MASRTLWLPLLGVLACGDAKSDDGDSYGTDDDPSITSADPDTFTTTDDSETADVPIPTDGPPPGNPDGDCEIPAEAGPADSSNPRTVVGSGTPESCTGDAFVEAVAQGGVITFDCGPDPVTILLDRTAKIFNDTGPDIVIDGGGLVTLDGGNAVRILYMNTCDQAQNWTTPMCDNQ